MVVSCFGLKEQLACLIQACLLCYLPKTVCVHMRDLKAAHACALDLGQQWRPKHFILQSGGHHCKIPDVHSLQAKPSTPVQSTPTLASPAQQAAGPSQAAAPAAAAGGWKEFTAPDGRSAFRLLPFLWLLHAAGESP